MIQRMHVLGWYGADGESYLSTWHGPPVVDVLFFGLPSGGSPMEAMHMRDHQPEGVTIERFPSELADAGYKEKLAYANERGAIWAFGWIDNDRSKQ